MEQAESGWGLDESRTKNMKLLVDASSITEFLKCPESFRRKYVDNKVSAYAAVAREVGIALHEAVDCYWKGEEFPAAMSKALVRLRSVENNVHPNDVMKYTEATNYLPDLVAFYYDNIGKHYTAKVALSEHQFRIEKPFGIEEVTIIGRLDRYYDDATLVDLKTASEIAGEDCFRSKAGWRKQYRELMLRDFGLAMYDWVLPQIGQPAAKAVNLEIIIKPYRGKPCRIEILEMPEILAYRERFKQQLEMVLRDMLAAAKRGGEPWVMSTSACSGKYGSCDQLAHCLFGNTPRVQRQYVDRMEHLEGVSKRVEL